MLNGGLVALRAILDQLKPSERKVAVYILENPKEIVKYSVQKLAELSGVSEATIIRLSKTLNMTGYQDLKLRVAGDLTSNVPTGTYEEIKM
ncbi:MAG: RpiR family transcriptional regulator, partial [Paenibacillus sp.]|nr:RpiR family transcriptional regulator [Paenibacillus sp.]